MIFDNIPQPYNKKTQKFSVTSPSNFIYLIAISISRETNSDCKRSAMSSNNKSYIDKQYANQRHLIKIALLIFNFAISNYYEIKEGINLIKIFSSVDAS